VFDLKAAHFENNTIYARWIEPMTKITFVARESGSPKVSKGEGREGINRRLLHLYYGRESMGGRGEKQLFSIE